MPTSILTMTGVALQPSTELTPNNEYYTFFFVWRTTNQAKSSVDFQWRTDLSHIQRLECHRDLGDQICPETTIFKGKLAWWWCVPAHSSDAVVILRWIELCLQLISASHTEKQKTSHMPKCVWSKHNVQWNVLFLCRCSTGLIFPTSGFWPCWSFTVRTFGNGLWCQGWCS